jgi:hypothetical protein
MVPNINVKEITDKRINLVYNNDISGYQALDFSKIDEIEALLKGGINVRDAEITSLKNNLNNVTFSDSNAGIPSGVVVYQSNLNKDLDNVTSFPEKSDSISNSSPSTSLGLTIEANSNRKELFVQNLSTQELYVKYGQGATAESFNFVLAKNTETNAGDGGSISDQSYTGVVSVFGTSPRYIAWERS